MDVLFAGRNARKSPRDGACAMLPACINGQAQGVCQRRSIIEIERRRAIKTVLLAAYLTVGRTSPTSLE